MSKPSILVQLDTDAHASVFDAVVAIDSGVEQLLQYAAVTPELVEPLVHGSIFTRGVKDLQRTAVFVGGSNVAAGDRLFTAVRKCFFGPMRVSVMVDANGANTTAAAAVLAAAKHLDLSETTCLVLAGTGPVGQRAARLLARDGARIRLASRRIDRAQQVCDQLRATIPDAHLEPVEAGTREATPPALEGVQLVIAAGAAGVELMSESELAATSTLEVAIDLNAVPPLGIAGIQVTDQAESRHNRLCYGAIGVGGQKMKIHKAALRQLFTSNEQVLDAEEIYQLGKSELAG